MSRIPHDYMDKVYAGWLGKIIGVRLGAPVEGWSYEQLKKVYGEIDGYLVHYKDFAADDDSNGPMFFLRALQDYTHTSDITAEQIGLTWLNYAAYEHGFYWWGGYGKSSEHTGYLNLRSGIMAPGSGSVEQNGAAVAEQIGGQIFIDAWGLVNPGDPARAAQYAAKAASVAHGGNGIYGGMFTAACISAAFIEQDVVKIIEAGLSVIPADCEYTRMAMDVIAYHKGNPSNWRDGFQFVKDHYGYDRYPGVCHIIPNSAVNVLSLLYGEGDFSRTLNICNMCGWDTDCNVANVGTIMGVRNGLAGIDHKKWREPINDFLACSSVIGSLNILDVPWCASYIANLAYKIVDEQPPEEWRDILQGRAARFHFEFSGSTHGFRLKSDIVGVLEGVLHHTTEAAHSGTGALKVVAKPLQYANEVKIFHKTYYRPKDFHDSRYDPSFSPILYPGYTISTYVMLPDGGPIVSACLYTHDSNSGKDIDGESIPLKRGEWTLLTLGIPHLKGACLEEAGVKLLLHNGWHSTVMVYVDDFDFGGQADYAIDFSKERMEVWNGLHLEVSQFTYLKGIWKLEDGLLSGSCSDFGEAYTGDCNWRDYEMKATLLPQLGTLHGMNFRVQGAIRSYAIGLETANRLVLSKNENGYCELVGIPFEWKNGGEYTLSVKVRGNRFIISHKGVVLLDFTDANHPYLYGQAGVSVRHGSHCHYKDICILPY